MSKNFKDVGESNEVLICSIGLLRDLFFIVGVIYMIYSVSKDVYKNMMIVLKEMIKL